MLIFRQATEYPDKHRPVCLALGFFDGVHLGHQQVIRQTINDAARLEAASMVVTFDRHPNTVVAPDRVPPLIYSLQQKIEAIESLGPDALLLLHFDVPFSQQTAKQFICRMAQELGSIRSICVGSNFVFGYKRSGTVEALQQFGQELGFAVHGLAAVSLDQTAISSTRIRSHIQSGDVEAVTEMLGRPYSISGQVVQGDRLGRKLGFPTANLATAGLALPPSGVYAAHARALGKTWRAVVNIGRRPTITDTGHQPRVEAHLVEFSGNLYGAFLEITPIRSLRSEQKFNSLDDLKKQIARDIDQARAFF